MGVTSIVDPQAEIMVEQWGFEREEEPDLQKEKEDGVDPERERK